MSVDGVWKTAVNSPMGVQEGTLTIKSNGTSFTGKLDGRTGVQDIAGTVSGNKVKFTTSISTPAPLTLTFDVTVTGNTMTGQVDAAGLGVSPLTGVRI